MAELDHLVDPVLVGFVDTHVKSLAAWDILLFFHRNSDEVLDLEALASRLGRRPGELRVDIDRLCEDAILCSKDGEVCYAPAPEMREAVDRFAEACQDRAKRMVFVAQVLS